jgi:DNA-directed RNA polymerase specialized sigma24 family protein
MLNNNPMLTLEQFCRQMEDARPVVILRVQARYRDAQLSDELAQDCLVDAWMKWEADPAYFITHSLLAWVTQRAYWRVRDRLDERARFAPLAEEHSADESEDRVKTPEVYATAREPDAEREQVWGLVHEAIAELPEDDQLLLDEYHWQGLTDKAIGDLCFGTDDGTPQARGLRIFRRRDRAQEQLRDELLARGYDPQTGQAP